MSDSITASTIADHVAAALDKVFYPEQIAVWVDNVDEEGYIIDYTPPFFLEDKCHEMDFGLRFKGPPSYPLTCTSYEDETFTVQNAEDWINHAPKFVRWYAESIWLMDKFAARKQ